MEKKAIYVTFWLITQTYRYIDISITFSPPRTPPLALGHVRPAPGPAPDAKRLLLLSRSVHDSHLRGFITARAGGPTRVESGRRERASRSATARGSCQGRHRAGAGQEVNWDALLASRLVSETDVRLSRATTSRTRTPERDPDRGTPAPRRTRRRVSPRHRHAPRPAPRALPLRSRARRLQF